MTHEKPKNQKKQQNLLQPASISGRFNDGTLPLTVLAGDITVFVPTVSTINPQSSVELLWNGAMYGTTVTGVDYSLLPDHVYELTISLADIPPTDYEKIELNYRSRNTLTNSEDICNFPMTVIFDRQAPGGEVPPVIYFTEDQLKDGITEIDLVNDALSVSVSDWEFMDSGPDGGDELTPWLGTSDAEADGSYLLNAAFTIRPDQVGKKIEVTFPGAALRALGDVNQYFALKLKDKAGNESLRSQTVFVPVAVTNPPSGLLKPVVPDFDDHQVITEADARAEVEVQIPTFTNVQQGDVIALSWGGAVFTSEPLTAAEALLDPILEMLLDYPTVLGVGNGPIAVNYELIRGGLVRGKSPDETVLVDLTTPGGVDPDPGTPGHDNLRALEVRSASGVVNLIPPADYELDAQVIIPHLGVDNTVAWELGDTVAVTWKDLPLTSVTVTQQYLTTDLPITVSSTNIIQLAGVGQIGVSYNLSRAIPGHPPLVNIAVGPTTPVVVQSLSQRPGGLLEANFPERSIADSIYREDGLDGTTIVINHAPLTNIDKDTRLKFKFVGLNRDGSGAELPASEVLVDRVLGEFDIAQGYTEITVSAEKLFIICYSWSKANYTLENTAGETSAPEARIFIGMESANDGCAFPPPTRTLSK